MRQELIDLLSGELAPEEQRALEARVAGNASLARELEELKALFALMQRGEEIEPQAETRAALKAAAERATAPSLIQQLRALPGLVRYRFRASTAFP
jgi:anti-sigma factor RsiW